MAGSAAAAGVGLFGATNAATAATTTDDFEFDRVLDAVDDLGADPNGNEDVVPILKRNYRSNTKIEFPPGTYLLGSEWLDFSSSVSHFGWVGTGSSPRDVQFVVPDGRFNGGKALGFKGPKRHHLFKNWSIQRGTNGDRAYPMLLYFRDGFLMEDIEWLGVTTTNDYISDGMLIGAGTTTQDGVNTARRCVIGRDAPARQPGYPDGVGLFLFAPHRGASHVGEFVVEDGHFEQQGANPTRIDNNPGVLTIRGGLFKNNDNVNVRVSGGDHPTKHSVVDGATIVVDEEHGNNIAQALHMDNSHWYHSGLVVKNTDIVYTDTNVRVSQPVIDAPSWGEHGSFRLENCRIRNENPAAPTMVADDPGVSGDNTVSIENCHFTGAGGDVVVRGRSGSTMRDSCFDMPNASVTGTISVENVSQDGCDTPNSERSESGSDPEPSVTVSTVTATDVGDDSAALQGSLDELVELSSVDVGMQVREAGADSWTATDSQQRTETGAFSVEVAGLSENREYEFCATASGDDIADEGEVATFLTSMPEDASTLTFEGTGEPANYEVTVSDTIAADPDADDLQNWDSVEGDSAAGWVTDETNVDSYVFTGEIDELAPDGAAVYVDGDRVGDDSDAPRTLELRGTGEPANYEVTVSGDLEADAEKDNLQAWDGIDGSTASGWVTQDAHVDSYVFTGEVEGVIADGAAVFVDGERVESDDTEEPRTLEFRGTGEPANYEVTVSGDLEADTEKDNLQAWDGIDGSTASGWVTQDAHVDSYVITGEIEELAPDGAAVFVDGERVDAANF